MKVLYLPRLNRAGWKSRLPIVCRAAMGIRYETFVTMVAVAVIAVKATVDPMTAHVMATLRTKTSSAAWTGMRVRLSWRKYREKGSTPSREMAKVTRWADMKQLAVAQVESSQRRTRRATAPSEPTSCTRYAAQLLE